MKTIKIFLASSEELKEDRLGFEIFINRKNKHYIKNGLFFELVIWEDFIDAISKTRLQDEYKKAITESDIFVCLFKTKVGKYTKEELAHAFGKFQENDKPLIYTYFKDVEIKTSEITRGISAFLDFKEELLDLGHFLTKYTSIADLKDQFGDQLDKIIPKLSKDNLNKANLVTKSKKVAKGNFTNSVGIEMVRVEAGTFQMGGDGEYDGKPVHSVTLSQEYYIGKYQVTQAQWTAVMGSNPSYFKGGNLPVEHVSWNDVQEFFTKLNEMEGTSKYRLPTEAEWEFAARGGNQSKGYTYAGSNNIDDVAWYGLNSSSTHEVGTKSPNELVIYDMSGNVYEWCNDWHGGYSSDAVTDPSGPSTGSGRVLRGGGWGGGVYGCRVADRYSSYPSYGNRSRGFRLDSSL